MKIRRYILIAIMSLAGVVCGAQERDLLVEADSLLVEGKIDQAREMISQYRMAVEEEARFEDNMDTAFFIVFFTALMVMVIFVARELSVWQREKLDKRIQEISDEKEHLEELLQRSAGNGPTLNVLRERLDLLNRFLTASITENPAEQKNLSREVSALLSNRQDFIDSTRLAFTESHPKFIAHLQGCGLTEWEINYCCLYALGLRGKEIGDYIHLKSHFNQSLAIRRKLGIEGMKLNTYIVQLLQEG